MYEDFVAERLDGSHVFYSGQLPARLLAGPKQLDELWNLHPSEYYEIPMYGRLVKTPRWQQAYGRDYRYSQRTNVALPVPIGLQPFLSWAQQEIEPKLNGLLLNWYDGKLAHYIGRHRDNTKDLVKDAPIVTISFGEERVFRLRPWQGKGFADFAAIDRTVFIMPYETNLAWTHEVPHSEKRRARRISVTMRAFEETTLDSDQA